MDSFLDSMIRDEKLYNERDGREDFRAKKKSISDKRTDKKDNLARIETDILNFASAIHDLNGEIRDHLNTEDKIVDFKMPTINEDVFPKVDISKLPVMEDISKLDTTLPVFNWARRDNPADVFALGDGREEELKNAPLGDYRNTSESKIFENKYDAFQDELVYAKAQFEKEMKENFSAEELRSIKRIYSDEANWKDAFFADFVDIEEYRALNKENCSFFRAECPDKNEILEALGISDRTSKTEPDVSYPLYGNYRKELKQAPVGEYTNDSLKFFAIKEDALKDEMDFAAAEFRNILKEFTPEELEKIKEVYNNDEDWRKTLASDFVEVEEYIKSDKSSYFKSNLPTKEEILDVLEIN